MYAHPQGMIDTQILEQAGTFNPFGLASISILPFALLLLGLWAVLSLRRAGVRRPMWHLVAAMSVVLAVASGVNAIQANKDADSAIDERVRATQLIVDAVQERYDVSDVRIADPGLYDTDTAWGSRDILATMKGDPIDAPKVTVVLGDGSATATWGVLFDNQTGEATLIGDATADVVSPQDLER